MINSLHVAGYKCLSDNRFDLSNLNLFVGPNASGKSSALQVLLLLRQSITSNKVVEHLNLTGALYEGGTASDILHPNSQRQIRINLETNERIDSYLFKYDRESDTTNSARTLVLDTKESNYKWDLDIFGQNFVYLNAERVSPKVTYAIPPTTVPLAGKLGKSGEFTSYFLTKAEAEVTKIENWSLDSGICRNLNYFMFEVDGFDKEQELSDSEGRIDTVVNEVLSWIIPGASFVVSENINSDNVSLHFVRDRLSTKTKVRPTHIGFGLTYILPIITAGLLLQGKGILIVENPEAHLHPYSQSRIGVFLAIIAQTGVQVFIETHSDHVVNGIRLSVKHEILQNEKFKTHFFSRPTDDSTAVTKVITCDRNGRMSSWPVGFFDQIENDLSKL